MSSRRTKAVGCLVLGLIWSGGLCHVAYAEGPTPITPTAVTVTTGEVARIAAFYTSKQTIATTRIASRNLLADAGVSASAAAVGNRYFEDFAASYAEDPDVQVRGLSVTSNVLGKEVDRTATRYRVSVTVNFRLYDTYNKRPFTGGETVDHLLIQAPVASAARTSGAAAAFVSDVSLGVSTAPVHNAAQDAAAGKGEQPPDSAIPSWQLKRKQQLAGSAPKTAEKATAASKANDFPRLNYARMATYASYWTESKRKNSINALSYGGSAGNDCTNFISQALHHGGWPIRDTTRRHRGNLNYWDYNMTGPGRFTYSWSRAEQSYRRVRDKAGKRTFSKLSDAWIADLVYADWNVGGAKYGDKVKDQAMIVSTVTKSRPYFSQKSGNRHNVPAAEVVRNTRAGGGTKWRWYGLRT